jgi:hypothetical protein
MIAIEMQSNNEYQDRYLDKSSTLSRFENEHNIHVCMTRTDGIPIAHYNE